MGIVTIVPKPIGSPQGMASFHFKTENAQSGNNDDEICFASDLPQVICYVKRLECNPFLRRWIISEAREYLPFSWTGARCRNNRRDHAHHGLFLRIQKHTDPVGWNFDFLLFDGDDLESRQRAAILVSQIENHFPVTFQRLQ